MVPLLPLRGTAPYRDGSVAFGSLSFALREVSLYPTNRDYPAPSSRLRLAAEGGAEGRLRPELPL